MIEDILEKVDKFIFLVDVIVLKMEEDGEIPLILRRPFLATSEALINVREEKVTMRVEDEEITFNVLKSMNFSHKVQSCNKLDDLASKPSMQKPPRTQSLKTKPPKPSIGVSNAMDPP